MQDSARERRSFERNRVEWPAELQLNDIATIGVVRDVGDRGAFVDVSSIGRRLRARELARLPDVGDQITISYTQRPFGCSVRRLARLRWIGRHPTQNCFGFGVQFEF